MTDLQTTSSAESTCGQDPTTHATTKSTAQEATQYKAEKASRRQTRPWIRRKRFSLPAAVILVFLTLMISTGGNVRGLLEPTLAPSDSKVEGADNAAATAAIGQSVRDGRFAFVVNSVQRPTKTFTDRSGSTQRAVGMYVIVRVSVTNIGYDPASLPATDQFLVNDRGQRYATSAAISSLKGTEQVLVEKINPGQTADQASLLFDVASGTTISSIELHDSATSTGVQVKLS